MVPPNASSKVTYNTPNDQLDPTVNKFMTNEPNTIHQPHPPSGDGEGAGNGRGDVGIDSVYPSGSDEMDQCLNKLIFQMVFMSVIDGILLQL